MNATAYVQVCQKLKIHLIFAFSNTFRARMLSWNQSKFYEQVKFILQDFYTATQRTKAQSCEDSTWPQLSNLPCSQIQSYIRVERTYLRRGG